MNLPKDIKTDQAARDALLAGMEKVVEAVATTLGPKGANVAIAQPSGVPQVIHDGVTVAKSVDLVDPFEDMGAQLVKSVAQKTNDKAGDGTTTSSVLTLEIARGGFKAVGAGQNPMLIKDQIDAALVDVLGALKSLAKPIKSEAEIEQVATISSANSDIGKMVAEATQKVGKDGVVTVESGSGIETTVEYKQGMEIGRGYLSTQFVTDASRVEAVVEDPYILITDKKINYNTDIMFLLEKILKETNSRNVVIIASEVIDEALGTLVVNKLRGGLNCVAIQAPGFGSRRVDQLWDIAILTGGTPILDDSGRSLDTVEISELGRASKVISDRDKTIILGGKGTEESIKKHISDVQSQIEVATTDYDKDTKKERLAKLAGGVAVINVGAPTEVELEDRKERVIDAVNATRAAVEEGIVAGGETALLALSQDSLWDKHNNLGGNILHEALKSPFKRLVENAGLDYPNMWNLASSHGYPHGIDVTDGEDKDMIASGIIDPVKVVRLALENAVSVATMAITTKVLIVDHEEPK